MGISGMTKIMASGCGGNAQLEYFRDLEYLTKSKENSFFFGAESSKQLGIDIEKDKVDFETLRKVAQGFHPYTGEPLVQGAGATHVQGHTTTFQPTKSVSVLHALGNRETRRAIEQSHRKAVKAALREAEKMIVGRTGKGGLTKQQVKSLVACFDHFETRSLDPQLHTHAMWLNLGLDENEEFGCIDTATLYKNKLILGQIYQNTLSLELKEVGIATTIRDDLEQGVVCEVAGVPQEVCDLFSKRSKEIDEWLKERNLPDNSKNRALAQNESRAGKADVDDLDFDKLQGGWVREAEAAGYTGAKLEAANKRAQGKQRKYSDKDALARFHKRVMESKGSNANEYDLFQACLESGFGTITPEEAREKATALMNDEKKIVCLGANAYGVMRISTDKLARIEERILLWALEHKDNNNYAVTDRAIVDATIARIEKLEQKAGKTGFTLAGEQTEAIYHITLDPGAIQIVKGKAGSGKSTLLKAACAVWRLEGRSVYGTAIAGAAAEGLSSCGMNATENCSKLYEELKHKKIVLKENDVIVIDESGMLSTDLFSNISGFAKRAGAKIILCGDEEQLQAIGAGGMHKLLSDNLGCVELKKVWRQRNRKHAQAGLDVSDGKSERALEIYKSEGRLSVSDSKAAMSRAIAKQMSETRTAWNDKFCCVDTRGQGRDINSLIRKIREKNGEVDAGQRIKYYDPNEKAECEELFGVGDRIAFLKASSSKAHVYFEDSVKIAGDGSLKGNDAKVKNGHFGTITGIERIGDRFRIRATTDAGISVVFDSDKYKTFSLGYAGTVSKRQGATFVENHYATENPNKHSTYVGITRHTDSCFLYTTKDCAENLAKRMNKADYNISVFEAKKKIWAEREAVAAKGHQTASMSNGEMMTKESMARSANLADTQNMAKSHRMGTAWKSEMEQVEANAVVPVQGKQAALEPLGGVNRPSGSSNPTQTQQNALKALLKPHLQPGTAKLKQKPVEEQPSLLEKMKRIAGKVVKPVVESVAALNEQIEREKKQSEIHKRNRQIKINNTEKYIKLLNAGKIETAVAFVHKYHLVDISAKSFDGKNILHFVSQQRIENEKLFDKALQIIQDAGLTENLKYSKDNSGKTPADYFGENVIHNEIIEQRKISEQRAKRKAEDDWILKYSGMYSNQPSIQPETVKAPKPITPDRSVRRKLAPSPEQAKGKER